MSDSRPIRFAVISLSSLILSGTVILSLFGFGAALAIEHTFGIPSGLVYGSALDLLQLSSYAISGLSDISNELWSSWALWGIVLGTLCIGLIWTSLCLGFNAFASKGKAIKSNAKASRQVEQSSESRRYMSIFRFFKDKRTCFFPFGVSFIIPWIPPVLIAVAVVAFSVLPLVGYSGANRHLQRWIIETEYCVPLVSRIDRLKPNENLPAGVTPCLSLWKNGAIIAKGRYIASTSTHIMLFDPASGDVARLPLEQVSLHVSGKSLTELRAAINSSSAKP